MLYNPSQMHGLNSKNQKVSKCCKIFKVCLTILGHYAFKGWILDLSNHVLKIQMNQLLMQAVYVWEASFTFIYLFIYFATQYDQNLIYRPNWVPLLVVMNKNVQSSSVILVFLMEICFLTFPLSPPQSILG